MKEVNNKTNPVDFVVVGVPKAGTSSLYEYLKVHPQIFLTKQKELHFFSREALQKSHAGKGDKMALKPIIKNWQDYNNLFIDKLENQIAGDISPSYFYFANESISQIKKYLGSKIKIIIILRDPIERA